MQKLKLGIYRHFKGKDKLYKVLSVATDSETLKEVVVYMALYGEFIGNVFVRDKEMFLEKIPEGRENPNNQTYRFEYLGK